MHGGPLTAKSSGKVCEKCKLFGSTSNLEDIGKFYPSFQKVFLCNNVEDHLQDEKETGGSKINFVPIKAGLSVC